MPPNIPYLTIHIDIILTEAKPAKVLKNDLWWSYQINVNILLCCLTQLCPVLGCLSKF